jgi:para-nitrobenzyl esterase
MNSNRRKFFQTIGAGAAGLTLGTATMSMASTESSTIKKEEKDGQILFIGDDIALANTQYGKVRGYILRDIYYFLGMPYGADTSGENRFMPPQKPKSWDGIYPAIWWGNSSPQQMEKKYADKPVSFRDHWNYDDVSEDCLRLNVFTPGYNDGKKRPVLVWIHGGSYTSGNGIEQDGYNGENLAHHGDIVFCSINHRLGPFGYSDLSAVGGEKYADSGNVGSLDLVAALEWVRDNIVNFGGDPGNVTIMGQSGGGGKVITLGAMPSAKGLFGKSVALSPASMELSPKEMKAKAGEYILKMSGLKANQTDKLQQMPWIEYYDLAIRAAEKLIKDDGIKSVGSTQIFHPHVDGKYIPQHPFHPVLSPVYSDIPMIITSTTNERSDAYIDQSIENISYQGLKDKLSVTYGAAKAAEIVDAYAKAFPDKKPVEIWAMSSHYRHGSVVMADAKSKQSAPVYLGWFAWQPPLFDNRIRAYHTFDICFWFLNTDVELTHTGGGARPRSLSEKLANSLLQFMKTGDPNGGGLPEWPKYTAENGMNMILNDVSEVKFDPDREARKTLPPFM